MAGDDLIRWHRLRCGKSEEIHAVMKDDLAGGRLPSGKFGANAAWWDIMVMPLNGGVYDLILAVRQRLLALVRLPAG
ncbi:MAG: hypothetical protein A2289_09590 [Deltaproteobacteria bacterium RIFOXYA12_FULL_58_15]|nr:MAG: hypothetical protein A2289_09590 [Deltaproteobacteria bacterium RIFOXYA12_FULL_58_15]